MASARIAEFCSDSDEDWGHTLFSMQFCAELFRKIVGIDEVVQKFIDANTTSANERKSLQKKKVADEKFRCLMEIITQYCNQNDLQVFKSFIGVLESTKNVDLAKQLSFIYNERVNSIDILNRLSKEKSMVGNLQDEINRLQKALEQTEFSLESLRQEKNRLIDNLRKSANEKDGRYRKEKRTLETDIKRKEEYIVVVGKEQEQLSIRKNDLEFEVEQKTYVITKRETEIKQKEGELQEAIKESNCLRIEVEELRYKYGLAVGKDKDQLSKTIESLEDRIAEKESTIMELRRNQTMTRAEIDEELSNITMRQEKKLDEQTVKLDEQTVKLDEQTAIIQQQNQKIDDISGTLAKIVSLLEKKE